MVRHLLKISDFSKEECERVVKKAIESKKNPEQFVTMLKGETLLMIFEKPSLRTRVSFETGMQQLGGHAIFYSIKDSPLGQKENIHDTAKVASRYVSMIAARVFKRKDIRDLAKYADVPVINILDDFAHPCQILCDFQTIFEKKGRLDNLKISYFGDAYNNVTYDLMRMAAIFGLRMDVACPEGAEYSPEEEVINEVKEHFGDKVYNTIIPRTIKLTEAPGFGKPIALYDGYSLGAKKYESLVHEILNIPNIETSEQETTEHIIEQEDTIRMEEEYGKEIG